ncbi:MAG: DedA family protein [Deltaproteobacteria bacterium]|jgi:membrane protein DedA with SNARE-associated domain|nr:DedA family protein [Deltaproteobacteria bacterium]
MLETFLAKYGYIAIVMGTAFEGETIMIMGGFSAHRGYLELLPWVVLAGFVGNFIQNMIYFVLGRRYGNRMLEKHPDWKPRLQQVNGWLERFQSLLSIGLRFVPGFRTIGGVAIGMSDVSTGRFIFLNLIGAVLWAVVIGVLGYLCGHVLKLIMGDIKHLEVPILVGIAVVGGLLFFIQRRRRGKVPATLNS